MFAGRRAAKVSRSVAHSFDSLTWYCSGCNEKLEPGVTHFCTKPGGPSPHWFPSPEAATVFFLNSKYLRQVNEAGEILDPYGNPVSSEPPPSVAEGKVLEP